VIRVKCLTGAAFAAALLCTPPLTPASAYDAEAGKQKAASCVACHGQGGNSTNPAVPSIAGQWNDYVVLALYQFRAKHRPSPVMDPVAAPLKDDDLGNLAAYYSTQPKWKPLRQSSADALAKGPELARAKNCAQCHTPTLAGQDSVPRVAGQHIDYLTAQLKAFRAGNRGDIDGNMTSAASTLTDADIATLADYISGLSSP
jgi:cytochrome c553